MEKTAKRPEAGQAARQRRKRPDLGATLAAILAHPLRCKILTIMDTRVVSPNELSVELDEPLGTISYHVRSLLNLGVIELVDEKPRRGAQEHFYRAVVRPLVGDDEFALLTPDERMEIGCEILQLLMADAGSAMESRLLGARPDGYLVRIPGYVDEAGWEELSPIYGRVADEIFAVMANCAKRKAADPGLPQFPFTAGLIYFEMPTYGPAD